MLIGASFDGISLLVAGTMSFINRRMGLTGSSRSTVQNNPSRTSPQTEKANAPLKLGRYLEKISDPCRSSDPSLDE